MKRKLIALVLGAMLMMPQASFAKAQANDDLTKIIQMVKSKIDVPDHLSEFNYGQDGENYELHWYGDEDAIDVTCESDGQLIRYYKVSKDSKQRLAKVSYEEAIKIADVFLQDVAVSYAQNLVLETERDVESDICYRLNYQLVHEGTAVMGEQAYVDVNKQTGEVMRFKGVEAYKEKVFEEKAVKIDLNKAKQIYLDQIGLTTNYHTSRYYKDKMVLEETKSFLTHDVNNSLGVGISALTGEIIKPYTNRVQYAEAEWMKDEMASGGADNGLTVAEQKAVDETATFISEDQIVSKGVQFFPILKTMMVDQVELEQVDEMYYKTFNYRNKEKEMDTAYARLKVKAQTGEIESFWYIDKSDDEESSNGEYAWSNLEASALLSQLDGVHYNEVQFNEAESNETRFVFGRMANGYPVVDEGMTLKYNGQLGMVTGYEKNWSNTHFDVPKEMLSKEEVVDYIGLQLYYMETEENKYRLVYNHESKSAIYDTVDGKRLNYLGQPYETEGVSFYADIKGHEKEAVIKKLFDSGIYLDETNLKPDEVITQKEWMLLLLRATHGIWEEARWESMSVSEGILEELELDATKQVTHEEAVKHLIKVAGYEEVAKISEIFKMPDETGQIAEDLKGYLAIAYGLKWLEDNRQFVGKELLTKADAMVYIYNMLENE